MVVVEKILVTCKTEAACIDWLRARPKCLWDIMEPHYGKWRVVRYNFGCPRHARMLRAEQKNALKMLDEMARLRK